MTQLSNKTCPFLLAIGFGFARQMALMSSIAASAASSTYGCGLLKNGGAA